MLSSVMLNQFVSHDYVYPLSRPRNEPCLILTYNMRNNVFTLIVNTLEIILYKTVRQTIGLLSLTLLGSAINFLYILLGREKPLTAVHTSNLNHMPIFLEEQSTVPINTWSFVIPYGA